MPAKDYREDFLKSLLDPKYASIYVETALEETIKDGDVEAFKSALNDVLEAASHRQETVLEPYSAREQVYCNLLRCEDLTIKAAISALEAVGIEPEVSLIEAQLV